MGVDAAAIASERALSGAAVDRVSLADRSRDEAALYIHLPWCARKCPYCDFNSHEMRGAVPERDYVAALLRDLRFESAAPGCSVFTSIYIGGGTPSLFAAGQIRRLLEGVHATANISADAEITLEANPGTLEAGRFAGFRDAGVNRVSIGVQSLRDAQLSRLGRVHSAAEARAAVAGALAVGFASVNLDLMYGLPGDGPEESLQDLRSALMLGTPHLSWYQLTLEPNTAWERRPPSGMPPDECIELTETAGRELLASHGFERYEVSAWAKPGQRCVHNMNYWRFGDYVGIGAGAHSKRRLSDRAGHERYSKLRNPLSYMDRAGNAACIESRECVSEPRTVALEYLMNVLRLVDGVVPEAFTAATGMDESVMARALQQARQRGLVADTEDRLCVTELGLSQLNRVLLLAG